MSSALENLDAESVATLPVEKIVDFVKTALVEIRELNSTNAELQKQVDTIPALKEKVAGLESDKVKLEKVASDVPAALPFKFNEEKLANAMSLLRTTNLISDEDIKTASDIIAKDAHAMLGLTVNIAHAALNLDNDQGEAYLSDQNLSDKTANIDDIPDYSEWMEVRKT